MTSALMSIACAFTLSGCVYVYVEGAEPGARVSAFIGISLSGSWQQEERAEGQVKK